MASTTHSSDVSTDDRSTLRPISVAIGLAVAGLAINFGTGFVGG
ncbi:hypothetical protein SY89_02331 [Halolamina pelagica]|uniref:Uncharacterized protein n=1 Tax=Halolamina pelagica TaxID=699431 RepID=A0A0P7HWY0_9EURY|nr:hypothetical protein SY89_02331 [Halolamina pelagica]